MLRKLMRLVPLPALFVAVLVAGCADRTGLEPDRLSPEAAQLARGGRSAEKKAEKDSRKQARNDKTVRERGQRGGALQEWKVVRGRLDTKVSAYLHDQALVDGREDVYLYAHGHTLRIPAGAVTTPTRFKLETFRKDLGDGTVMVGVDLKATVTDRRGRETEVGAAGFLKPVTLYVSAHYALEGTDLAEAEILWLVNENEVERVADRLGTRKLTTRWGDVFATDLDHFSKYILGTPW